MAAHAIAPLALGEVVARLCLWPERQASCQGSEKLPAVNPPTPAPEPIPKGAKGERKSPKKKGAGAANAGSSAGRDDSTAEQQATERKDGLEVQEVPPTLALVCARRAALLFRLGPT